MYGCIVHIRRRGITTTWSAAPVSVKTAATIATVSTWENSCIWPAEGPCHHKLQIHRTSRNIPTASRRCLWTGQGRWTGQMMTDRICSCFIWTLTFPLFMTVLMMKVSWTKHFFIPVFSYQYVNVQIYIIRCTLCGRGFLCCEFIQLVGVLTGQCFLPSSMLLPQPRSTE